MVGGGTVEGGVREAGLGGICLKILQDFPCVEDVRTGEVPRRVDGLGIGTEVSHSYSGSVPTSFVLVAMVTVGELVAVGDGGGCATSPQQSGPSKQQHVALISQHC